MLLGVEGLVASFIISTTLGFILMQSEYNGVVHYPPSIGMNEKQRLIHTWTSYETRSMIESLIMIINILKFQETFNQLEQADKHKTEFLCRMSHELRTPLSGIIGSIDILKFAPLTDEYSKLIDMAKACSTNLLQVINDILDFSKIEAGKMKLIMGRVKLRDLVQSSLEVVSPLLGQKPGVESKVVISEDAPDFFTGDLSKLKQILVNLLSNAVKFTSRGSITMQVCMESKQDISRVLSQHNSYVKSWAISAQFIKFSVKDSGLGVAKKDFATIFSAFEQASHRLEENVKSGTGLGLNICLLLVKLMQGAVGITSDGIGHGSAFTFWIPYDKSDEEVIALAGSTSTSSCRSTSIDFGKQVSILLTEDNAVNQVVIKGLLTRLGCTVDIASNGLLAIQKFKKHSTPSYDIILLDLEMPVKDGIETVTELRKMGIKTPIIALTAHAVEEKRTMALKAGMDDFLMKPCSIDTLKQCIERHIVIK
jgi:signal transduction histidine kinase/CheY-like chemotaxis protein